MYIIEPMTLEDIDEVAAVERQCFTNPWPIAAYRRELRNQAQNYYVVLRRANAIGSEGGLRVNTPATDDKLPGLLGKLPFLKREQPRSDAPIIGFAGMWHVLDEAHVTTIGVHPSYQGRGLGEALFMNLVDETIRRQATWLTLEVRVSNYGAQQLYRKYGFSIQGKRPRYYTDNHEDAYIMWSESFRNPTYLEQIEGLRTALDARMQALTSGVGH